MRARCSTFCARRPRAAICSTPSAIFHLAKARKKGEGSELDDRFSELRKYVKDKYDGLLKGLSDRQTELDMFLESGRCAAEFDRLLLAFDDAYSAVKREEGKLDYGDLEHLTLRLLDMDGMGEEVRSRFKRVFVDEYQDVNPVQERIITLVGAKTCSSSAT